jgi:hypothetical protein
VSWQVASGTLDDSSGKSIKALIFSSTGDKLGSEFLEGCRQEAKSLLT